MKRLLLLISFYFTANILFAQADTLLIHTNDSNIVVQVEAQFPGGLKSWKQYLEQNLNTELANKCIKIPKGQKAARQTVIVSFRVDKEGLISDVVAENAAQVCPKLAAEAIRVIKQGPRWIPALQNGKAVIYRQKQSITWELSEE